MDRRKDISEEVITFYSAKDVANQLKISPITLKKHSLLLEKISNGAVRYQRNDGKSRVYTVPDVLLIRRTIDKRDNTNLTYEKAVKQVLTEEGIITVPSVQNDRTPSVPSNSSFDRTQEMLFSVLNEQNDRIDKLIRVNEELAKSNQELSLQMRDFLENSKSLTEPKLENNSPVQKNKWWKIW